MKYSILCSLAYLLLTTLVSHGIAEPINSQSAQVVQEAGRAATPLQESAETYLKEGTQFLQLRRYDKAIESFKNAIRLQADLAPAHLGLGSAYLQLGSYSEAVECVKRAVAINPEDAGAHQVLGNVYMAMRRPGEAATAYKEAIRLNPKAVEAHLGLGNVYGNTGRLEQAIEAYGEALRLNPNLTAAHHNLGLAYFQAGRMEEAIASFKRAIQQNPRDAQAANMIGEANNRLGHYVEAVEAYERLEQLAPLQAGTLVNRGFAYLYLGRGEAAATDAQAALKMRGWRHESAPFLALLAHFGYRQAKRETEAGKVLDEATAQLDAITWPNAVLRYLRREITAQSLLTAPMNNDQMTEARAYLGMDLALAGKKDEALVHLRWVKEYGNRNFVEYPMAVTEISRLEGGAALPRR